MKLVFPTQFGQDEFYTVIDLKETSIDNVTVAKKNSLSSFSSDSFVIQNGNKGISIVDINNCFINEQEKINNAIDAYLINE